MNYQETWGKKSSYPRTEKFNFHQMLQNYSEIVIFPKMHPKFIKLLGLREDPRSGE